MSKEFDEPTIETIQAVIFIVQNDFFKHKSKKAMIYVSLAIRMATTLELHNEPHDPNMTFLERESRRRTYWSLIVFDRLAHSGPHWQVHLRTDTLQIQMPCRDYYFENNIPVITETLHGTMPPPIRGNASSPSVVKKGEKGIHAYIVIGIILWCEINKYVMEGYKSETIPPWKEGSTYHALETRLQNLFATIPKEYQYSRENLLALDSTNHGTALVHLHNELLVSLCFLSRSMYPFNYKQMKFDEDPPKAFLERAATNIMACAKAQSSMIEDVLALDDFNMAPFVGFGVFAVSSVHIANSFSPDPAIALAAKNSLAINLKFLVIMREYFYIVGVWCIILKERYFQKAQRHKLKQSSINFNGSITDSIRNSESGEPKQETEGGLADGFSRPGTPPVVYAPPELMSVAANKQSEPANETSSSNEPSRSGTSSPQPKFEEKWQGKRNMDSINELQQQAFARTWKRAVPQSYEPQPTETNMGLYPNKKVKLEKTHVTDFQMSASNFEPASPSQFADILTRPSMPSSSAPIPSHPAIIPTVHAPVPSRPSPQPATASVSPIASITAKPDHNNSLQVPDNNNQGTGNNKNNILLDTSGEWLNSLELHDFTQFAHDSRASFDDRNNPVHWFNGKQPMDAASMFLPLDKQASGQGDWMDMRDNEDGPPQLDDYVQSLDAGSTTPSSFSAGFSFPHTPKTQNMLDEIFQQVARDAFPLHDTTDSPESMSSA